MKKLDLIDKVFGKLKVEKLEGFWISKSGKTKVHTWLCKCSCGVRKYIRTSKLLDGSTKSCGCSRSKGPRTEKGLSGSKQLYNTYKSRSKKLNRVFNISFDSFVALTSSKCYYCGLKPIQKFKPQGRKEEAAINAIYTYNGLDRLNSNLGYEKENCVACCKKCNMAKSDMNLNEFLNHISSIYNNRISVN